jgi:hypothetical protein
MIFYQYSRVCPDLKGYRTNSRRGRKVRKGVLNKNKIKIEVLGDLGAFAREIKNIISQRRRERRGVFGWENTSHTLRTQRLCERKKRLTLAREQSTQRYFG